MNSQLEYMYIQLLSIITSDRMSKLENNPGHCMSAMSGTDEIFEQLICYTSNSFVSLLNSFPVMTIDETAREKLNTICERYKVSLVSLFSRVKLY